MYRIIQFVRHKIPFLWSLIDRINEICFNARYSGRLKKISGCCAALSSEELSFTEATVEDLSGLTDFFNRQPEDAFKFFHPHGFDKAHLEKLIRNKSFIMILAIMNGEIAGYAFIRAFANGKSFRGKIVDINHRGMGIAKKFGILTTEIARCIGIRLFGTISKDNLASMASSKSSNEVKIIEELPDGYFLIQYLPKNNLNP